MDMSFGEKRVIEIHAELAELKRGGKKKTQEYFDLMQELNVFSQLVIDAEFAKEKINLGG